VTAPDGYRVGKPEYPPTTEEKTELGSILGYYHDTIIPVTITVPENVSVGGSAKIEVKVKFQYCDEKKCYPPKTKADLLELKVVGNDQTVKVEELLAPVVSQSSNASERPIPSDLAFQLGIAFLAGLLLNVMPCVLPVIAIKVLSFVQHSGHHRGRVIALNVVYALGVLAVFLILGHLAVTAGKNWGQQFQSREFTMGMACVVFAMGLSLLGVFEIPLPGFFGSSSHGGKEGYFGVFLSGAMTTLLATPCTGPFLGPLLLWSLKQSPLVSYMTWGMVGLGMASPYLVLGVVPGAVKLLPKPGDWMVTFKQVCGFIMLATALFLLNAFKEKESLIRGLFIMLGIGFAAWIVGTKIDVLTPVGRRWLLRIVAVAGALLFSWFPNALYPKKHLPWIPFSESKLQELVAAGQPVLIDFTADWCANCKTNELLAIENSEVAQALERRKMVALYADYTDYSPEITKWIREFGSDGIPLTVVIAPGDLKKRVSLDGLFNKQTLLDAIEKTVPDPTLQGNRVAASPDQ
jgi:thiol:disulfide interchange protein